MGESENLRVVASLEQAGIDGQDQGEENGLRTATFVILDLRSDAKRRENGFISFSLNEVRTVRLLYG